MRRWIVIGVFFMLAWLSYFTGVTKGMIAFLILAMFFESIFWVRIFRACSGTDRKNKELI